MPIGLTLPFAKSTSSLGFLASSETQLQATYYNLKSLLLTDWGERVNHYHLGCNLTEFLFSPNQDDVEEQIRERIRTQVSTWLPYVTLSSIDIKRDSEHMLSIQVGFYINGLQNMNSLVNVSISQA